MLSLTKPQKQLFLAIYKKISNIRGESLLKGNLRWVDDLDSCILVTDLLSNFFFKLFTDYSELLDKLILYLNKRRSNFVFDGENLISTPVPAFNNKIKISTSLTGRSVLKLGCNYQMCFIVDSRRGGS